MADELPADLDPSQYVGPYSFPDTRRRRAVGAVYAAGAATLAGLSFARGDGVLVNDGFLWAAGFLGLLAAHHAATAWRLVVDDAEALVAATKAVGFPVGHAGAQLGWRGLRSRPTWHIVLYSADDPPTRRGLVLVDGVDGDVLGEHVEVLEPKRDARA